MLVPLIDRNHSSGGRSRVDLALRRVAFWLPLLICTYAALDQGMPSATPKVSDVTLHLFAFVYLSAALRIAHPRLLVTLVVVLMIVYGGLLEIAQSFLPPRQAEWGDLAVDVLGIGIGLLAHYFLGEKVWRLFLRLVRL